MNGPYTFVLPRSFQPTAVLPDRLLTRADDARWLIDTILRKTANRDTDVWGLVRLHSDILRRVMYQRTQCAIVDALEAGGVIERAPYRAGVKSIGYRLGKRFLGDHCIRVRATDPRLIARIEREQQRQTAVQHARLKGVHFALAREQRGLSISTEADGVLDSLPWRVRLCQHYLVDRVRRREFAFSVSSTMRFFNAITGLKKELRPCLRLHGQRLGSVDLVSAQPALLGMMLTGKIPPFVPKQLSTYKYSSLSCCLSSSSYSVLSPDSLADFRAFAALVWGGSFYELLSSRTGLERSVVKKRFLVDCLAKRGVYPPSDVERAFGAVFPNVLQAIQEINRDDHGTLIRLLQRLESWLVIERVVPRLLGQIPLVTLHDSIFSCRSDVAMVAGAFHEVFDELNCRMALHIDMEPTHEQPKK